MQVEFENGDLEQLITTGACDDNKLYKKLSRNKAFMTNLIKVYQILCSSTDTEMLKRFGSLHYEKLKHKLSGYSSVRIGYNTKYRMLFTEHNEGIMVKLIEINEHYGDK